MEKGDVTSYHKFILQSKSGPCWHHKWGWHEVFKKMLAEKWHWKTNWKEVLRQSNYSNNRRFQFGADGSLIHPKSSRQKKGLDLGQSIVWLPISTLKTLFPFYLNLQLQNLQGRRYWLPDLWCENLDTINTSAAARCHCHGLGDQSRAAAWHHFPQCSQLGSRASPGTWKEQGKQLDMRSYSSSPFTEWAATEKARCDGEGTVARDGGAGGYLPFKSSATWLWQICQFSGALVF